ncbi:helix-turn-helix domain-containing protein [Roseovarius litorisediminis]|uniref:helix-turn-helix domain-containing protein n=1 Tax=Roseovarius litorisediminis TaxID=1312363 RepID=UPI000A2710CB
MALEPGRRPNIGHLAEATGISVRSIQRQLFHEQTTFSQILDKWAINIALRELETMSPKTSRISKRLGYAEPANFTRTFIRWTGTTPREYRRRLQ